MQITSLFNPNALKFLDAVTTATVGNPVNVEEVKVLVIEIVRNSVTANTLNFEQQGPAGGWYPLNGINTTLATPTADIKSTATTSEIWTFDVTGITAVRMNLTALTGTNISVIGRGSIL